MYVSSMTLAGPYHDMIVAQVLPINAANTILGSIFSMLFSDFNARRARSIPTLPMDELKSFSIKMFAYMSTHY